MVHQEQLNKQVCDRRKRFESFLVTNNIRSWLNTSWSTNQRYRKRTLNFFL